MANEQYGFVFAVTFLIIFSAILVSMPTDLQGKGATANEITPVDPNLLTDFTSSETFNASDFVPWFTLEIYEYNLDSRNWICGTDGTEFDLNAKIYWFGLWLGQLDAVRFIAPDGTDRSLSISFDEIEDDAEDGSVFYNLIYDFSGTSAGGLIFFWNSTLYPNASDAWDNNVLFLIHGVGITVNTDIVPLLIGLLFLQLPDIPMLVNILLIGPVWASIIYVLWYVITTMIPFLSP